MANAETEMDEPYASKLRALDNYLVLNNLERSARTFGGGWVIRFKDKPRIGEAGRLLPMSTWVAGNDCLEQWIAEIESELFQRRWVPQC